MATLVGKTIGRYQVVEELGQGGMATVYKAMDTRLEREVAIKLIRKSAFSPEALRRVLERFEREAKSLARLSHANIVKVFDFGKFEGSPFLVLEYLPGGTLRDALGRALPWRTAIQLLLPVARALHYAHQNGIIHRDVKPSNILLRENGEPMLTDFGIAKLLAADDSHTLTASGVGIGTPMYMPPEQGMGKKIDARADVYALGIVLYELITVHKPYQADTPMEMVLKQMNEPLPRPTQFVPDLPEAVEAVLIKALGRQPEDRFESMEGFVRALEGLVGQAALGGVLPVPVPQPTREAATGETRAETRSGETTGRTIDQSPIQPPPPVRKRPAPPPKPAFQFSPLLVLGIGLVACLLFGAGLLFSLALTPEPTATPEPSSTPRPTATRRPTETPPPSETPFIPTWTPSPLPPPTSTPVPSASYLYTCLQSPNSTCVRSFGLVNGQLLVTINTQERFNSSNPPVLYVDSRRFNCVILSDYPYRLYCTGSNPGSGDKYFRLDHSNGLPAYAGTITIPNDISGGSSGSKPPGGGDSYTYP